MTAVAVATRQPVAWRYTRRATPLGLTGAALALSTAWTFGTRLDTAGERFLLTLMVTAGVASVLADPARLVVGPSPTNLATRRSMRIAVGVAGPVATWALLLIVAARLGVATGAPTTHDLLELATVGATQLAVGSVLLARREDPELMAGTLVVALAWHTTTWVPQIQQAVHPSADHPLRWGAILLGASALTAWCSRDPAGPR